MSNASSFFGTVTNPTGYGTADDGGQGLFSLLSNLFKLLGVIAGIFFIVQIILAGYGYLSANGDEKKVAAAWATIWQSAMGFVIVASAFIIASAIGKMTGINPTNPTLYGPTN